MAVYPLYVTLGVGDAVQDISPTDTVLITVDASFGTAGTWFAVTPFGCAISASSGIDGSTVTITPIAGASSYSVILRTRDAEFGVWLSSTISGTISTPPPSPTYSVANVSTNEGASATASVTTTNVANGTTLYWTVTAPPSDVSVTSGSFTINANAGSFTIPAIADAATEGSEVYTISVRTGSTSGTVVASATLTINDTSTTPPPDTTPDAFSFTDQSNVALSSTITSNAITVSGINAPASISVSGGTYSINGGAYTSASGTVTNGQTVTVRHTSSSANSTATNTTLTIGGVSDTFTSTTAAAAPDTTPNAFAFTDQTNVALSATITSNAITVSGIDTAAYISISGGAYSINGGPYTSASGTVTNGQTVSVRHTSSSANSTATNTTLTIGGVSDTFTSTTTALPSGSLTAGLQTFYENGDIALDVTDRTSRLKDIVSVAANTTSSITVIKEAGELVFAFLLTSGATTTGSCFVNQSTGVVTYQLSGPAGGLLYYGVF